jgi:hypothetical protein
MRYLRHGGAHQSHRILEKIQKIPSKAQVTFDLILSNKITRVTTMAADPGKMAS